MLGAQHPLADGQQRGELVPGPAARLGPPALAARVSGARRRTPARDGQQRGVLVPGPGRIPASPVQGEVAAGGQGVRVLGAGDPLADGQQRGELVPGPGRIPRRPGPAGEVAAGGQGVRVLGGRRDAVFLGPAASRAVVAISREQVPGWPA